MITIFTKNQIRLFMKLEKYPNS